MDEFLEKFEVTEDHVDRIAEDVVRGL